MGDKVRLEQVLLNIYCNLSSKATENAPILIRLAKQTAKGVPRGPFHWHSLASTPAGIIVYIHYQVWGEITHPVTNVTVQSLKIVNG